MRPLVGCKIYGSLWWLPSICFHQGGTAMSFGHRFTGVGTIAIFLTVPAFDTHKSKPHLRLKVCLKS